MHVVVIAAANHPLVEPFAGGLESLTATLVHGLRQRGVRVTLFAGAGSDPALDANPLPVQPLSLSEAARLDPSMVQEGWLRQHHAYLQAMLWLRDQRDVDIVHNHSLHHLPVAMSAVAPAPMLTTLHTPPTPWLESALAIQQDPRARYVAVSRFTARTWAHVAQVGVVPNGVDTSRWTPGPGGPDLVWAGRLVPEKAPHLACEAARRARRRLHLVGPVSDQRYFDECVRPLLNENLVYLGHLDQPALARLVGTSAATLVTPVWDEPYGLVAAESLACGTPVVALDRGGLREVVDESAGVLVSVGGDGELIEDDLSARLAAAIPLAESRSRGACRSRAEDSCSHTVMVEAYLEWYAAMLSHRAA
ncbi:MAG: glycosyltransferase [Micrococcales bacterium]|nr:glycosyltransferase [Micrococcales bacterium]